MAGSGALKIRIYNEAGNLVDEVEELKPAGAQFSRVKVSAFAPGIYYYLISLSYDSGNSEKMGPKMFGVLR
jgi:hypothetical protein